MHFAGRPTVNRLQSAGPNRPIGQEFQSAPIGHITQSANRLEPKFHSIPEVGQSAQGSQKPRKGNPPNRLESPIGPTSIQGEPAQSVSKSDRPNQLPHPICPSGFKHQSAQSATRTNQLKRLPTPSGPIGYTNQSAQTASSTKRPKCPIQSGQIWLAGWLLGWLAGWLAGSIG